MLVSSHELSFCFRVFVTEASSKFIFYFCWALLEEALAEDPWNVGVGIDVPAVCSLALP